MRKSIIPLLWLIGALMLAVFANRQPVQSQELPTFTPLPTFTGIPSAFPTSTITPTPGCAAPLNLSKGALAAVSGGVYVRYKPDVSSPYVNYYEQAVEVRIAEGPVCNNNYNWWRVRGPGNDGWVAEGRPPKYLMRFLAGPPGTNCPEPFPLTVGERAYVLRDLKIREQAGETGLVLTVASKDMRVTIIGASVCADDTNWWKVQVTVLNVVYSGWAAEADGKGALLESEADRNKPLCAPPLKLAVGSQAYVNYKGDAPKSLRAAPDPRSTLIATLFDGIGFEILDGPVCGRDGLNWWSIRILSRPDVTGWLAEGGPTNYWIQRLGVGVITPVPGR
jgi:hypothetical protein